MLERRPRKSHLRQIVGSRGNDLEAFACELVAGELVACVGEQRNHQAKRLTQARLLRDLVQADGLYAADEHRPDAEHCEEQGALRGADQSWPVQRPLRRQVIGSRFCSSHEQLPLAHFCLQPAWL